MYVKIADVEESDLGEDVSRRILASGGAMMTVRFTFKKGAVGSPHPHPHEQVGYVLEGSFELTFDGDKTVIEIGDTYDVSPNVEHGVVALQDGVLLDVFTPQRQDIIA